jgi:TATA-binding protein-associated factor Taf7
VHNYTSTYARKQGYNWTKKHWCEHVPKSVETGQGGRVTILWNQQMQTDRTIPNKKPDIIIRDNEKRTCMLIDAAISEDRKVVKKEADILKYKDLKLKYNACGM